MTITTDRIELNAPTNVRVHPQVDANGKPTEVRITWQPGANAPANNHEFAVEYWKDGGEDDKKTVTVYGTTALITGLDENTWGSICRL